MNRTDPLEQLTNDNINNYKNAGKIAFDVLNDLIKMCKSNVNIIDICQKGDELILKKLNNINKKNKGIAFPTCVSLNNVAGYYSPLKSDKVIQDGDLVKIELGVHIDNFPALVCFTVLIKEKLEIDQRKKDVMIATIEASREIYKNMTPTRTNLDITKIMKKYSNKYNCSLPYSLDSVVTPGLFSYQMSQNIIDGCNDDDDEFVHRYISSREHMTDGENDFSIRKLDLEEGEVYSIDIVMSTGNGKLNKCDDTTIYRRQFDKRRLLRLKSSKATLSSFKNPFPMNTKDKPSNFRFGLKECISQGLVKEYYPMADKEGEYVARIKFTVMVGDKPTLICGYPADNEIKKI